MSSQWDNKYAIMRDLSLVQGCVPVDVTGIVEAGDKPPKQNINEDTEEDFYQPWVGGNGDSVEPDLALIKHMLDVVRNYDAPIKEELEIEKMIQISKLNPHCKEFCPQSLALADEEIKPQAVTKTSPKTMQTKFKKTRNVAVQSLLENMNFATENNNIVNIEPTHTNNVNNKASEKVSGWLETHKSQYPNHIKKNTTGLLLDFDPSSMFKKKKPHDFIVPKAVTKVKQTSPSNCGKYVPSNNAAKYYKKYLECSKMKEMVQENVWTKVERQMKAIDERRAVEAELFALSLALSRDQAPGILNDDVKQKLAMVLLPSHRHALPTPCRVCELHSPATDDHLWRIQTDEQTETIGDAWRNQHKTFIAEHVKKVDDFCKRSKVDCNDNISYVDDRSDSQGKREKESVSGCDIENRNVNKIENWRNRNSALENDNNTHINSWRSKPEDEEHEVKDKDSENACADSVYTENAESWASLDEEDEIDAWKFEIYGDDDTDHYNEFHEASDK